MNIRDCSFRTFLRSNSLKIATEGSNKLLDVRIVKTIQN